MKLFQYCLLIYEYFFNEGEPEFGGQKLTMLSELNQKLTVFLVLCNLSEKTPFSSWTKMFMTIFYYC